MPLAVWYDLRDDGPDALNPEHNYGLLDAAGAAKPALLAIGNLMGLARTRRFAGMLGDTPPGIHAMRFDGPADALWIVWTDRPTGRSAIEYATHDLISATGLAGNAVQAKDRSGRAHLEIDAAAGPVYLLWRTAPPR